MEMTKLYFVLAAVLCTGCGSTQNLSQITDYDLSSIRPGGIYELRTYLHNRKCLAPNQRGDESVAAAVAIAAPLVEKGIEVAIDAALTALATYGDSLTQPVSLKAVNYPTALTLNATQCIYLVYGRYGGSLENNISANSDALKYLNGSPPSFDLGSNVGFAMQIAVQKKGVVTSLAPVQLYYPKSFHSGSAINKHTVTVRFSIGDQSFAMEFGDLEAGKYYDSQALMAHWLMFPSSLFDTNQLGIEVVEGPDNKLLGEAIKGFASDGETKKALIEKIQVLVNDKIKDNSENQDGR